MADPVKIICESNNNSIIQVIASAVSAISAAVATYFAMSSLKMQRQANLEDEKKKDIKASRLMHPDINSPVHDHRNSVITCSLFNPSTESAFLKNVIVLIDGKPTDVDWSKDISDLGMPINPNKYIEIKGVEDLFIRRCDGEWFMECIVEMHHSFSKRPIIKKFSIY